MKKAIRHYLIMLLMGSLALSLIKFSSVEAVENIKNNTLEITTDTQTTEASTHMAQDEQQHLLATSTTNSTEFLANNETENTVTPSENDFDFSKGMINGLKKTYIAQLSDVQKKNIRLVIPKSINGINVTSINNQAFYSYNSLYSGCLFTFLDLSLATDLQSIGNYAFYGYPQLKGTLLLPDSLISIGNYAFYNSGFSGELVLPSGLSQIGDSAFRQTNPTVSFTGTLMIPEKVVEVQNCAFLNQKGITKLEFKGTNITTIGPSAFKGSGLLGALTIPGSIQTISKAAFSGTQLETVYLPLITNNTASYIQADSFSNNSMLKAIICDKSNYNTFYNLITSADKTKLAYPMEVTFNDGVGGTYAPIKRLYNQTLQLIKQENDVWAIDSTYTLPEIISDSAKGVKKWSFNETAVSGVTPNSKVAGSTLFVITVPVDPVISYGPDIEATYDGTPHTMSVNATHPQYKEIAEASEDDVVFYYTWAWLVIGSSGAIDAQFDMNEYSITEVYEPDYTIACRVTVQACIVKSNKAKVFYTDYHDFGVSMKQAESIVNPQYPKGLIKLSEGFPTISLANDDTLGTIEWDDNQELKVGKNTYTWTFTPEANTVGSSNYKTVTGTAELNVVDGEIFAANISSSPHGTVSPNGHLEVAQGQALTIQFKPDVGYCVEQVVLNGNDITDQITHNKYTLQDVQGNIDLEVNFALTQSDDVKNMIDDLPQIAAGEQITQEQIDSILDTKLNLETLAETDKNSITEEEKVAMCAALAQLPQIKSGVNQSIMHLENEDLLLENLTKEDILQLKNDPTASINITMNVAEVTPGQAQGAILESALDGATLANCFNIEVMKVLETQDNLSKTNLSELKSPMKIVIPIPKNIISTDNNQEFFIIRLHTVDGKVVTDILKDEDTDLNTITISSDKYSLYALAYETTKTESYSVNAMVEGNGSISPSGILQLEKGQNQEFIFTPSEGYQIKQVFLDGKDLGPISSYTLTNINQNHLLQVIFEKISQPTSLNFTVHFDSVGGSMVAPVMDVVAGSIITEPLVPIKQGYLFDGWYQDSSYQSRWQFNQNTVEANLTLFAKWVKEETITTTSTTQQPATGDRTGISLVISLMIISIVSLGLLLHKRKQ